MYCPTEEKRRIRIIENDLSAEAYRSVMETSTAQGFGELAALRMEVMPTLSERLAYNWGMIDMEAAIVMKLACNITKEIYEYNKPIAA